jgi:SAM-dependent methyltransferase
VLAGYTVERPDLFRVRANTDRSARLAFGDLVEPYDRGRPVVPAGYAEAALQRLRSGAPHRQLEVGAGTGQLTAALTRLGPTVALEPSPAMAARLRHNLASEVAAGRLQVWERSFESLAPGDGLFDCIWSADTWHWLEPAVAYPLAAGLLTTSGLLINTWRFPALADAGLSGALNDVYKELSPNLVRDEAAQFSLEDPLFAEGRDEVERSGAMTVVDSWLDERTVKVPRDRYLDWQLSYAHIAYLTAEQRQGLRDAVSGVLAQRGLKQVEVRLSHYTVASAKSPTAAHPYPALSE